MPSLCKNSLYLKWVFCCRPPRFTDP